MSSSAPQRTHISNNRRKNKEEMDGIAKGEQRAAAKARDMAKALEETKEEREFMV